MTLEGKTFVLNNVPDQTSVKKCIVDHGGKVVFALNKQVCNIISGWYHLNGYYLSVYFLKNFLIFFYYIL